MSRQFYHQGHGHMLDQILALVNQFGQSTIVENADVPNQHNEAALGLTANAIMTGLKGAVAQGALPQLLGMMGNTHELTKSPVVQSIIQSLTKEFTSKLSLSADKAGGVAANTVQQVLSGFLGKMSASGGTDLVAMAQSFLAGQSANGLSGLAAALDVNHDGKVDLNDAVAKVTGDSALGAAAGKLLGSMLK